MKKFLADLITLLLVTYRILVRKSLSILWMDSKRSVRVGKLDTTEVKHFEKVNDTGNWKEQVNNVVYFGSAECEQSS